MQEIINHIKQLITDKGLKQKYVAEQMGLSQNDFSNMMNEQFKTFISYKCQLWLKRLEVGTFLKVTPESYQSYPESYQSYPESYPPFAHKYSVFIQR